MSANIDPRQLRESAEASREAAGHAMSEAEWEVHHHLADVKEAEAEAGG